MGTCAETAAIFLKLNGFAESGLKALPLASMSKRRKAPQGLDRMFLVRSAFWLTVAFVAIGPKDVDVGAAAGQLSGHAIAAGQQFVTSQILAAECQTIECLGGQAIVRAAQPINPSDDISMQDSSQSPVPLPRPRPERMG